MSATGPTFAQRRAAIDLASRLARASAVAIVVLSVAAAVVPARAWPVGTAAHAAVVGLGIAWFVPAGLFLAWVYRAVSNAKQLGVPLKWGPGMAVVAYVVPVVSLVLPYYVMKALHRASDPSSLADAPVFRERAAAGYREGARELVAPPRWDLPAPILAWWLLFDAIDLSNYYVPWVDAASMPWVGAGLVACCRVAAGVLCALVVWSIDARQRERCRRLEAAEGPVAA